MVGRVSECACANYISLYHIAKKTNTDESHNRNDVGGYKRKVNTVTKTKM